MKPIELARELNIPQPTMHRLVTGKSQAPHYSTLAPIAAYFNITVEQLTGEAPLPKNLLATRSSFFPTTERFIEIPLLEWQDLPLYLNENKAPEASIAAAKDLSEKCFAIRMPDSSMEPQFAKGSILVLDPDKEPFDRSYVLVGLQGGKVFIFRQLLIDAEHKFLKPLNPDLTAAQMRLLEEGDKIIASLVEARQVYTAS